MNHDQPNIIDIIKSKKRTLSAEIIPPRNGAEIDTIFRQVDALKQVPVDFVSVTKGAGGSLRGGTLPIAQMIKARFELCALAHFTCRDYNSEEIENLLMDHHYFGIHNILALRGDPPDGSQESTEIPLNRHQYAYQLVKQIDLLNQGHYLVREGFDKKAPKRSAQPTNFCIGVAAYPEDFPFEKAIEYLKIKVDHGAQYAITQMLFSAEPYKRFLDGCEKAGINIPILPGIRILSHATTAKRMRDKFKVNVPDSLVHDLENVSSKSHGQEIGKNYATMLGSELLRAGAPGIHVFVMNDEVSSCELLKNFL